MGKANHGSAGGRLQVQRNRNSTGWTRSANVGSVQHGQIQATSIHGETVIKGLHLKYEKSKSQVQTEKYFGQNNLFSQITVTEGVLVVQNKMRKILASYWRGVREPITSGDARPHTSKIIV